TARRARVGCIDSLNWRLRTCRRRIDNSCRNSGSLRTLGPGKSATVALFWSNWCGPGGHPTGASGTPPDSIAIGLASGTSIMVALGHAPRCDAPQDPSVVSVGPFTPTTRRLPESSRLSLHAAIVGSRPIQVKSGLRAFRVHRGQLLRYRVAL